MQNVAAMQTFMISKNVDLSVTQVTTGASGNTGGIELIDIFNQVPIAVGCVIKAATISAVRDCAGLTSVTSFSLFLKSDGVNSGNNYNLDLAAGATASVTVTANAIDGDAVSTQATRTVVPTGGLAVPTGRENRFHRLMGTGKVDVKPMLVLASAGADTAVTSATGELQVILEVDYLFDNGRTSASRTRTNANTGS